MSATPAPRQIVATVWPDKHARSKSEFRLAWPELCELVRTEPQRPSKGACRLLKLASFGNSRTEKGSLRSDSNLARVYGVEGDYDGERITPDEAISRLENAQIRALVYPSPSHTPERPRWRVLAPLSHPCEPAARLAYAEALNGALGGILAPESGVLSQSFFFGPVNGAEYRPVHTFDDPDEGWCLDELPDLPARVAFRSKPNADAADDKGGTQADYLVELLSGTDIHGSALRIVGRMVRDGLADEVIHLVFRALAIAVRQARGEDRAAELLGPELQRMIDGARTKAYAPEPDYPEAKDGPTLVPVDVTDLSGDENADGFVMAPVIPRREVTLLGAHGGAGKSILALTLAAHIAVGRSFGPLLTEAPGRVLFVSLEDPGSRVRARLHRVCVAYGLDPRAVAERLIVLDGTEADALMIEGIGGSGVRRMVWTATASELRTLAAGADLVVVDNASDAYGGNENERRAVRQFVRGLASMVRGHDGAVLLLAHVDKASAKFGAQGNAYSGSTAWHNSSRSRLALTPVKDDSNTVDLAHEKLNTGRRMREPLRLRWTEDGVLVPDTVPMREAAAPDTTRADDAAILAAIAAAIALGENVNTGRNGPGNTHAVLKDLPDLPRELHLGASKERFWSALTRLERAGKIVREEFTTTARHKRERYRLSDSAPVSPVSPIPPYPPGDSRREPAQSPPVSPVRGEHREPAKPAKPALPPRACPDYCAGPPGATRTTGQAATVQAPLTSLGVTAIVDDWETF